MNTQKEEENKHCHFNQNQTSVTFTDSWFVRIACTIPYRTENDKGLGITVSNRQRNLDSLKCGQIQHCHSFWYGRNHIDKQDSKINDRIVWLHLIIFVYEHRGLIQVSLDIILIFPIGYRVLLNVSLHSKLKWKFYDKQAPKQAMVNDPFTYSINGLCL